MPGKPSSPLVSILDLGVGVGSTDTTDRMGKTRSEADGLMALKGDSEEGDIMVSLPCRLGLHGLRCGSEPRKLLS